MFDKIPLIFAKTAYSDFQMETFCTIITPDFIPFARVLYLSLKAQQTNADFHVLLVAGNRITAQNEPFDIDIVDDLLDSETARGIYRKYAGTNEDRFRWALKPVYIAWLLRKKYDKVIFLDPDLYFTGDPGFLLKELDTASVILTPHWCNPNPMVFEDGLFSVMKNGMYNAGFIGASKNGLEAMEWWAGLCHYKTEKSPELGIYDDQKYLDLLPVEFENVRIIRHRGCNLAAWNLDTNKRGFVNGILVINHEFPPVFIHFAKGTIENILNGNDALLRPILEEYLGLLRNNGIEDLITPPPETFFHYIKRKTLIRTRIKRFLFRLAEKL